jgi:hypothetical protein
MKDEVGLTNIHRSLERRRQWRHEGMSAPLFYDTCMKKMKKMKKQRTIRKDKRIVENLYN